MKTLRILSLAALTLMLAACNKEINAPEQYESPEEGVKVPFSATISAPNKESETRTTYTEDEGNINVVWNEGDQIALVHGGHKDVVTVGTPHPDGSVSISGDITVGPDGEDAVLVYPAYYVYEATGGTDYTVNNAALLYFAGQDGTLDFIQNNLDFRQGAGKLSYDGNKSSLKENVSLSSLIALWKITLQDNAATPNTLVATKLTMNTAGGVGVSVQGSARSVYYFAFRPDLINSKNLTFEAWANAIKYTYSKAGGVTLEAGKYYQSAVRMEASCVDLSTVTGDTYLHDGDIVTGTLNGNYKIIIWSNATITLDGVTINGTNDENCPWAGLTLYDHATIILKDGTTNTIKGFDYHYPGIFVPVGHTLTIKGQSEGTGILHASSSTGGPGGIEGSCGIGGGISINCGDIVIEGGNITAVGSRSSSGIGAGKDASCSEITITGGTVTASGGSNAPGIGSGYHGFCSAINLSGGTVTATGGYEAPGIGSGWGARCGNITITSGVTGVTATNGSGATYSINPGTGEGCGSVTIGGVVTGPISWSPFTYPTIDLSLLNGHFLVPAGSILTGTLPGNYKISIPDGAAVTLNDATIEGTNNENYYWAGITCEGNATINLSGTNTVKGFWENYPGIYVPVNKTVTILGTGSLTASSNGWGAGIGGGYNLSSGSVLINSGTIVASGGREAAGIGSGGSTDKVGVVNCGTITITGGDVTATGGVSAAGIGSGCAEEDTENNCGAITITNTVTRVTATKGNNAPNSIGAGLRGTCGTVTIGGVEGVISASPYIYTP